MKKIKYDINKWLLFFSLVFSASIMSAHKITLLGDIFADFAHVYYSEIMPIDICVYVLVAAMIYGICLLIRKHVVCVTRNLIVVQRHRYEQKVYFSFFLVLLFCWLPFLLSYVPGGLYSDTVGIILQAQGIAALDNHHPILYTLIWRCVLFLGRTILGKDIYFSLELFTLLQYSLTAAVLSYVPYKFYCWGINKWLTGGTMLFFALFNVIPFNAISLWKDVPFSLAILGISIFLMNFFCHDNEDAFLERKKFICLCYFVFAYLFSQK